MNVENFPPAESAAISILIRGANLAQPTVGVQSADSIGERVSLSSLTQNEIAALSRTSRIVITVSVFVCLLIQPFILSYVLPRVDLGILRRFIPSSASLNNTAFLYLQLGLDKEAEQLLETSIATKGADAITLSNYALALGLKGDQEASQKRFEAAEWYANRPHERAVVEYNRAVLLLAQGQLSEGKEHLKKAVSLSPTEIRRYSRLSVHIRPVAERDPDIGSLVAPR